MEERMVTGMAGSVWDFLLKPYADKLEQQTFDYATFKEEQYDKLAEHVRKHINMPLLYKILERND